MFRAKKRVLFAKTGEITFIPIIDKLYSDRELTSNKHMWIKSTEKYKRRLEAGIIEDGGSTTNNTIDGDLVAKAQSLEITFDGQMDQSVLEQKVKDAEVEKAQLIEILKEEDVTVQPTTKLSTLRKKVEDLTKA